MPLLNFIQPNWPAPANVKALQTTRIGGVSVAPFHSLNFGVHVGDDPAVVAKNRQMLNAYVPSEPVWLSQIHGVEVVDAAVSTCLQHADASYTTQANVVCVTMTADCLPVLLCDKAGSVVAAVHAGWRGLCDGVIEATVQQLNVPASEVLVWLGPAIGPNAFEVGKEVRDQFIAKDIRAVVAFKALGEKWLADIYMLARQRLNYLGVTQIYGGDLCTYTNQAQFFSYRRDGNTGRMASLIWLA